MALANETARTLLDQFRRQINTLYRVEIESAASIPMMIHAATTTSVRQVLQTTAAASIIHTARLEKVFASVGARPDTNSPSGVEGLLRSGRAQASLDAGPFVRDANLILLAQALQQNEITLYGAAHVWAQTLQHEKAAELLRKSLDESQAWSNRLMGVAHALKESIADHACACLRASEPRSFRPAPPRRIELYRPAA